jgi:hypothetical protein
LLFIRDYNVLHHFIFEINSFPIKKTKMQPESHINNGNNEQPVNFNTGNSPKGTPPSNLQIWLLATALILFGLLLAYLFLKFWPSGLEETAKGSALQPIQMWGNFVIHITLDVQFLLLVMITGGLGSFIHTATSFGDYVGNNSITKSWFLWYILRPFIGMALAVVFYLVIRGGFLSAGTSAGSINPFGIAALAGLVGMFSKQATDKLNEVFNTLFRTAPGGGDSKRKDNLTNPIPSINDIEPKSIEPLTENVIVTIKGTGFVKGIVLRINGTNRETEFIDEMKLTAKLLPEDVEKEGELELTVFNPAPGGGESTPMKLKIATK